MELKKIFQRLLRGRARTKQVQRRRQPQKKKPKDEQVHVVLAQWRAEIERLQSHPLTQAKIINERVLSQILDLLEQMNSKLDVLTNKVSKATSKIKQDEPILKLSDKEIKILSYVKGSNEVLASQLANVLNMSRSNASLKLNKLYSAGCLEKRQDGKDMLYKIKRSD